MNWWREGSPYRNRDIMIADGSIRSGKTIACICSFLIWSMECFSGQNFILSGKTIGSLKKNVIGPMLQILTAWGIPYRYVRSGEQYIEIGTNTYYLYDAHNESSQDKIQGLTAAGALADEAALFPRLWAATDGLIYQQFADEKERFLLNAAPSDIQYAVIGVDFGGTKSAHSFTLTGLTKGFRQIVILDEFYHDNKKNGRLSPKQVEDAFVDFVRRAKRRYRVYEAYCDSAEQTLIEGLKVASVRSRLGIDIKNAQKRPINDRIAFYNSMIAQDRFRIMKSCTAHIKAFEEAVYDPDEPVKDIRLDDGTTDIDSLDSMEYATESIQDDIMYL